MKTFPWLLFLSFEVISLSCWPAAGLTESVYRHEFKGTFPFWTQSVLAARDWFWAIPLPWLIYAIVLSLRKEVSASSLFKFAGTICLGSCLFLAWVIGGLLLPYYATHIFVTVRSSFGL